MSLKEFIPELVSRFDIRLVHPGHGCTVLDDGFGQAAEHSGEADEGEVGAASEGGWSAAYWSVFHEVYFSNGRMAKFCITFYSAPGLCIQESTFDTPRESHVKHLTKSARFHHSHCLRFGPTFPSILIYNLDLNEACTLYISQSNHRASTEEDRNFHNVLNEQRREKTSQKLIPNSSQVFPPHNLLAIYTQQLIIDPQCNRETAPQSPT